MSKVKKRTDTLVTLVESIDTKTRFRIESCRPCLAPTVVGLRAFPETGQNKREEGLLLLPSTFRHLDKVSVWLLRAPLSLLIHLDIAQDTDTFGL